MDLYKVLGVTRAATLAEIKSAYRSLALKYHPDVAGNDPEKKAKFQQISSAYNTLSNEATRRTFDQAGGSSPRAPAGPTRYSPQNLRVRSRGKPVPAEHFNMVQWNAWHYGDNATAQASTQRKSWMDMKSNPHQAYYSRKTQGPEAEATARAERARGLGEDEPGSQKAGPAGKKQPPPTECVVS